jgi:hypothetical protein
MFSKMQVVPNKPTPIITEDDTGIYEEPKNTKAENQVELQYWFLKVEILMTLI